MFQVKLINFDGISNDSAIISNFWISQGSVATQLKWDGIHCNSYIDSFFGNLPVKEYRKPVYICRSYDQVKCIFWDTVYKQAAIRNKGYNWNSLAYIITKSNQASSQIVAYLEVIILFVFVTIFRSTRNHT